MEGPGYELSLNEENDDELFVVDTFTGQFIKAYLVANFTLENVRTSLLLRQKLRDVFIEGSWKRNNVEASIFQFALHCTNGKAHYRGLASNLLWAYSRVMLDKLQENTNICDANG